MSVVRHEETAWTDAVAEASAHVEARGAAEEEALEKQRPRDSGPIVAGLMVLLVLSLGWAGYRYQSPPEVFPINEVTHLAWFVVDAVELVEDFAADQGRLPSVDEASTILDEDVVYQLRAEGYEISAIDGDRVVEYSSDTPLAEWLSAYSTPTMETDQ